MRTEQRILNAIEQIPLPLTRDPPGMGGGIRLIGDLARKVSLRSNLVEMAAVQVAREMMRGAASGTVLCEALEQFVDGTTNAMSSEQRATTERFARLAGSPGRRLMIFKIQLAAKPREGKSLSI